MHTDLALAPSFLRSGYSGNVRPLFLNDQETLEKRPPSVSWSCKNAMKRPSPVSDLSRNSRTSCATESTVPGTAVGRFVVLWCFVLNPHRGSSYSHRGSSYTFLFCIIIQIDPRSHVIHTPPHVIHTPLGLSYIPGRHTQSLVLPAPVCSAILSFVSSSLPGPVDCSFP